MNHYFGFVLFMCIGWSLSHAADTKTYTVDGQLCVFPFLYKSTWYMDCTGDGTSDGRIWCSITADYHKDKKWGYCQLKTIYTIGGNANGQPCVSQFNYKSKWYWGCTTDGSSEGHRWCSTTWNYDMDKKWGYCLQKLTYAVGGNANGQPCVFPFEYKSKRYWGCTGDGSSGGRLWCATTADYDKDKKWGYCTPNLIYTVGGNANGQVCVFPFMYKSKWYSSCTGDGTDDGRLWCATTGDYHKDKSWGYCP
ncbi:matrix metalloproteinase-9-like isoform X2 [Aquarana catesbeiana]|uniref:matrix metalloproteinase-9-like isoform X2 n=1 Tax=Aquarana catesbeiana TaxID=8400 RepID=UPI003CCA4568